MTLSSIILASAYAPTAQVPGHDHHDGYAAPVSPDRLGGAYSFSDIEGRPITAADFRGHWTLLFFGYSRCKSSCPIATPTLVKAARTLREQGVDTHAVFVDIDAPPIGFIWRVAGAPARTGDVSHDEMERIAAMRALSRTYGGELVVLTGTRGQLADAARAFMVAREHTPPRKGEQRHSINHSSRIYMIGPDASVAGYGYHDSRPAKLVETVAQLNEHKSASWLQRKENSRGR